MKLRYTWLLALGTLASCQYLPLQRSGTATTEPANNKFGDITLQQIYTLQDERNTTDLLPYLSNPNSAYRQHAAMAFASVQDTAALQALLQTLQDSVANVRGASAYALGQLGHRQAEADILEQLQEEQTPEVQAQLLEALGKVGTSRAAEFLASYKAPNPEALAGQAWGIYRLGMRQQHTPQVVQKAIELLAPATIYEARLAAAHFLARTPRLDLTQHRQQVLNTATSDKAPEIRMAAAQALAKVRALDKATFLSNIAQSDPDYRVRLSAVRSMSGLEFSEISRAIVAALQDQNVNTAIATSEFLVANNAGVPVQMLQDVLPNLLDARVRSNVIWVILKNSQPQNRVYLNPRFKQQYQNARSAYDKAHLLKALSGDVNNYEFIAEQVFLAEEPVIATTGMDALILMRQQPDFPKRLEPAFADIFKHAVASGDVALVGMAAAAIRDPKLNLRSQYSNFAFLTQAQEKLQLPRDMETNIELQKTIDYLSGKQETVIPQNPFTHPIDWQLVKTIHPNQQVVVRTEKGSITMQLFVEDAPGSVANFVELTQQGFFNELYFHRVVPNFVAQGGDKRGDGWGSSDYSIRSEFTPLHYYEGYVGMASAGKDTESNQWFITHSPAPHLDGRYTIFAKVIDGMDVVHRLEVGDKIVSVEVLNLQPVVTSSAR
ncbi:cyclophilin family peptidyl-prolyl cis-trans isomerase [Pontibacter mucosus]|uniref:peptidylprolyl isomerase n=1 Tax=Pontibacter mucosus TaxID=1649266 RepID=A0A2T5Y3B9_9BACT|nr:peptidylprolyl isomerase [Pontibacter mucosus]PTX10474.1 cyclophilin family peptidyl-prolyl cis-trans isomerase [Pontibacter mucosus]